MADGNIHPVQEQACVAPTIEVAGRGSISIDCESLARGLQELSAAEAYALAFLVGRVLLADEEHDLVDSLINGLAQATPPAEESDGG